MSRLRFWVATGAFLRRSRGWLRHGIDVATWLVALGVATWLVQLGVATWTLFRSVF